MLETRTMTPAEAVAKLGEILAERAELTADDIYEAMGKAGVPEAIADRAYKFTQIACGHSFLAPLGVQLSADYLCFGAEGDVLESGKLNEEPYFIAAQAFATRRSPSIGRFACMSANV